MKGRGKPPFRFLAAGGIELFAGWIETPSLSGRRIFIGRGRIYYCACTRDAVACIMQCIYLIDLHISRAFMHIYIVLNGISHYGLYGLLVARLEFVGKFVFDFFRQEARIRQDICMLPRDGSCCDRTTVMFKHYTFIWGERTLNIVYLILNVQRKSEKFIFLHRVSRVLLEIYLRMIY